MIKLIGLGRLTNAMHYEFMIEFDASIMAVGITPDKLDIEQSYKLWKASFLIEEQAMKNVKTSVLTPSIVAAKKTRGNLYTGLKHNITAMKFHYDASFRIAAERILLVFEEYGNPTKLNYKAETGILRSLIGDLEAKLSADMAKLGTTHWIAPLKQANLEVEKLIGNRTDEELMQPSISMSEARLAVDPLYKEVISRIDALAKIKGGALFTGFASKHNARIDYYKTIISQSGSRLKTDVDTDSKKL